MVGRRGPPMPVPRLALALLLALALAGCEIDEAPASPRTSGPLEHSAYVWQRAWTQVGPAIEQRGSSFAALLILAAELEPGRAAHEVAWEAEALEEAGVPIGLVVRVGAGALGPEALALALAQVERADAAELALAELQIDYDCPSARLAEYAAWLAELREALRGRELALTITALPDWLDHAALGELLAHTEGWVLQVHSLAPPHEGSRSLVDLDAARDAVERAAKLGRPFRVALPTHHYLVAKGSTSRLASVAPRARVAAEQAPLHATRERFDLVGAEPDAIAELLASWQADRPPELIGVVWFRLPVAGDRFAWSWPTLRAVMAARPPHVEIGLEVCRVGELSELALVNRGEADLWTSELRSLNLELDRAPVAFDAMAGFRGEAGERSLMFTAGTHRRVEPGESLAIGWVRDSAGQGPLPIAITPRELPLVPCRESP